MDSTTAIAYMRNQGGTLSLPLLSLTTLILNFAHEWDIRILPVFVPSEENLLVNVASRFLTLSLVDAGNRSVRDASVDSTA